MAKKKALKIAKKKVQAKKTPEEESGMPAPFIAMESVSSETSEDGSRKTVSEEIIVENPGTENEEVEITEAIEEERPAIEAVPVDSMDALLKLKAGADGKKAGVVSDDHSGIIEAALFMSSRPLSLPELGKLIGIAAPGFVEQRLKALAARYSESQSAIEIVDEEGKYYMRVKQEFVPHVRSFAQAAEISQHALRTLAYIAKQEGITKHALFLKLGGSIYEDVSELVEKGFVTQKKAGRTKAVSTTAKFKAYFGNG